jgi:hypothetical protein
MPAWPELYTTVARVAQIRAFFVFMRWLYAVIEVAPVCCKYLIISNVVAWIMIF